MEDFTANFTDEQMNSMNPATIEQEADKIERSFYKENLNFNSDDNAIENSRHKCR